MLNTEAIYRTARKRCFAEMQPYFDAPRFENSISMYLDDVKKRYESEKFAAHYQSVCPLKGAVAADYNTRLILLAENEFALCSLRFFSLRPDEPFVMVEFSTIELTEENVLPVLHRAKECFGHLPVSRYHFTSHKNLLHAGGLSLAKDKVLVKGVISADRTARFDNKDVELLPMAIISDEHYVKYGQELELFLKGHPSLRGMLNLEKRGYLDLLGSAGFLFEIRIKGSYAGMMAIDEGFEYSCYGLSIIEEFLFEEHHGKGYGKVIQSKLIEHLMATGWAGTYLFGSIAAINLPSLRTAAANSRMPFLYSYFVEMG